jgi:hypothetical protein
MSSQHCNQCELARDDFSKEQLAAPSETRICMACEAKGLPDPTPPPPFQHESPQQEQPPPQKQQQEQQPRKQLCHTRRPLPPVPPPQVSANRLEMISKFGALWTSGRQLTYCFLPTGNYDNGYSKLPSDEDLNTIREAFKTWTDLGISISFKEVKGTNAIVRIAFAKDGAWSGVGSEILNKEYFQPGQPTMNFGWIDLVTAVHEIGHTLSLLHEHQNPNAGIVWNREAVYEMTRTTQNPPWTKEQTDSNILDTIPPATVRGTAWDPASVMHYEFEAGLIKGPSPYDERGIPAPRGLSATDKTTIKALYPPKGGAAGTGSIPALLPQELQTLAINVGEGIEFTVEPTETRQYDVRIFGKSDAALVLLDDEGNKIDADNDTFADRNAALNVLLKRGNRYKLTVRVLAKESADQKLSLMYW